MGMNRNVINEIGFLDEESFGKGFGEENDWCQRAAKKYYYNLYLAQQRNKDVQGYRLEVKEIVIASPRVFVAPPKLFDLGDEEE